MTNQTTMPPRPARLRLQARSSPGRRRSTRPTAWTEDAMRTKTRMNVYFDPEL
jgi:hypothetical protein